HDRGEAKARTPQHSDTAAPRSNMPGADRLLPRIDGLFQAIVRAGSARFGQYRRFLLRREVPATRQPPAQAATLAEFLIRRPLRILVLHERRELVEVL